MENSSDFDLPTIPLISLNLKFAERRKIKRKNLEKKYNK
jgi:hypothetical protein